MAEKRRFDLHLPGLLKVLAEHLYSTRKVGVRELLQNAHDSCVRRRLEDPREDYRPRIDLAVDRKRRLLILRDNGSGLTEEEIVSYLATIGRGYTRELREKLSFLSPGEAAELIGQFGLGFLSAFLLAEEVTLTTRSCKGGPALRWVSRGDEHYELTRLTEDHPVGTAVHLQLKPSAAFLLRSASLAEAVRTYADFLPIPIHLDDDPVPVNLMAPPWEADDPDQAIRDYVARKFQGMRPLWVLRLKDARVAMDHDSLTIPLEGFLFVPPASTASVREYGDLNVFIRRMFICDRERDLLPPWARFVRGVVECPLLQPTASREGLHQDENFESVRAALEHQLGQGLHELARKEPEVWRQLVRGHSDVITSWAVRDDDFFEQVEELVCFRTSRGLLSLPDYLRLSGGSLYYVTREMGSLQEQMLAEGRDVPAIDASWFAVTPFLEKYASRHPEVGLVQLDGDSGELIRPVAEGPLARLVAWYRDQGIPAGVAVFKPSEVPALMVYPDGAETVREASQALEAGDLPEGLAGLVDEYVQTRFASGQDLQGKLILNASSPLLRRLAEHPPEQDRLAALLTILHQMARLFCGRMLSAADAAQAYAKLTTGLETLGQ